MLCVILHKAEPAIKGVILEQRWIAQAVTLLSTTSLATSSLLHPREEQWGFREEGLRKEWGASDTILNAH